MLKVRLLCVGGLKETYWRQACAEYEKRLGRFCKLQIVEIAESRTGQNPSQAEIERCVHTEGERLVEKLAGGAVVALCIEGKPLTSPELSCYLQQCAAQGDSVVDFVVGGSFGLSPAVKRRAGLKLSMSHMTFPHQLARVMLLEQVYRSFMIASGAKYHK